MLTGAIVAIAAAWPQAHPTASAQEPPPFEVVLSAQSLQLEIPGTGGRTLGETVGTVTAFADGEECASVDVSAVEDNVVLQLGLPGQPEACSSDGAVVNFQEDRGLWLSMWFILEPGGQAILENFAPVPPPGTTPPGPAESTATPAPPGPTPTASVGTRSITPPDTGSAGLLP